MQVSLTPVCNLAPGSMLARLLLVGVALELGGGTALAADGVLEINQTCAVQSGCFSGDVAGLPVTINGSAGHGYRLTSDLVVPNENTDGIQVSAPSIVIDLAGFQIARSACINATIPCIPAAGTGAGIERNLTTARGTIVRNGNVVGMGSHGVVLGDHGIVENVTARWNAGHGIFVDDASVVTGCTTYQNNLDGIFAAAGSNVSGNTTHDNLDDGIEVFSGASVTRNTAYRNGDEGIRGSTGVLVSDNVVYQQTDDGIAVGSGGRISNNAVNANGGDGIEATTGTSVQGNSTVDNTGFGLVLGDASGYRENTIYSNTAGTVTGGLNLGGNNCELALTCP